MNDAGAEKSLQELEVKVAFLEDALGELSDEYYRQQKELEALKGQVISLIAKYQNSDSNANGSEPSFIEDEKPPHY